MENAFERNGFFKRLGTMLSVDLRRMFLSPLIYIVVGACIVAPILILVMTTMMDGTVSVDPQTGEETVMEGFDNTWQAIASTSDAAGAMDMSLTGMCNVNMLYFAVAVLVCLFVAGDFRSGYAKNLFAVRAQKSDYVISKTLVCFLGSSLMILGFVLGTVLGGAIANLPFDAGNAGVGGILLCVLCKVLLCGAVVPIYLLMSVIAKQKTWLAMLLSFAAAMLLFTMIPMLSPLDANGTNVAVCAVLAGIFCAGLGSIGGIVLRKTALV